MRNLSRPMAAHGKDRPSGRSFPLSAVLTAAVETEGRHEGQGRGIRSTGTDSMSVALTAAAQTEGMQKRQGKGKTNPAGWFSMSAPGAQRVLPPAGGALNYFWLIPALAGIKRGFRPLRRATQGNGAHVLGPWPNKSATALRENAPQGPFLAPQGSRKAGESFSDWCGAFWGIWLHFVSSCRFCPFFLRLFPPL